MEEILEEFSDEFNAHVQRLFLTRLNLKSRGSQADSELLQSYFTFLESSQVFYEQAYFDFFGGLQSPRWGTSPQKDLYAGDAFENFKTLLSAYEIADLAKMAHPYFTNSIPCSLLIEEIEAIWKPIAEEDDWGFFYKKIEEIRSFRGIYNL